MSLLLLLTILPSAAVWAQGGVQGRVAWRDDLLAGMTVRAYRSLQDLAADRAAGVSAVTSTDGSYRLELAPGSYYLTARDYAGRPQPGGHFSYHSGSPVQVRDSAFTPISFKTIRIPREGPVETAAYSGIKGEISFEGHPLERVYLYVYKNPEEGFKGPGYAVLPVEKGTFRLRLPPGEYWVLARKRAKGGRFGPIEVGDYFNVYYANPIRLKAGEVRDIRLETTRRLVAQETAAERPFRGIRGRVTGPGDKPVADVHVFAYRDAAMTGTPAYFSAATGSDGIFELLLPEDGRYYLLARQAFGGPAAEGELYGKYGGTRDHAVTLQGETVLQEIRIHVEKADRR